MSEPEMEVLEIDGHRWATIAEAARVTGRPSITVYKAREESRLPWRLLAGRLVVDIDAAIELWPAGEPEPAV